MSLAIKLTDVSVPQPAVARPPQNLQEAARQFEALMIGELLKAARSDENGWLGSGEDNGDATSAGLAEEQFAQALAQNGGLGLSAQITASISKQAK